MNEYTTNYDSYCLARRCFPLLELLMNEPSGEVFPNSSSKSTEVNLEYDGNDEITLIKLSS